MNEDKRQLILTECKNGEHESFHGSKLKFGLGKPLYYGVTVEGFPWIVWETRNWGAIQVGESRTGITPISGLRNDANARICLNTISDMQFTAKLMSRQLVGRD